MTQASQKITQQYVDGGVIPAHLVGQDAVSKTYVDGQNDLLNSDITKAAQAAGAAQSSIDTHKQSSSAHSSSAITYSGSVIGAKTIKDAVDIHVGSNKAHESTNITYTGLVSGAYTVKQAIDLEKRRVDNIVSYGGNSNIEIVDARGDYIVLSDRLNANDTRLSDVTKDLYPTMTKAEIQGYIDQYSTLKFKSGVYNIDVSANGLGFVIPSNRTIIFEENAVINVLPNSRSGYDILMINGVQNVRVEYPTLIGDRVGHTGTTGEWGNGINIKGGSTNIKVIHPVCKDFWGDGIYINNVNDCTINHPVLDNNRRNGMSIVCAENLYVIEPIITNTNGTNPQAGIDIEPNTNAEWLKNVKIIRPFFKGNAVSGLQIYLFYLDSTSQPVDIEIVSPLFDGDKMIISGVDTAKKGYAKIDKPHFKNIPITAIDIYPKSVDSIQLDIIDPYIEDYNVLNSSVNISAIQMILTSTSTFSGVLGGVRIVRPVIKTSIPTTLFGIRLDDLRTTNAALFSNIEIIDPDIKGASRTKVSIGKNDGTAIVTYGERSAKVNSSLGSLMDFRNDAPYVRTTGNNPSIFVDKDLISNNDLQEYTIDVRGNGATVKFMQSGGAAKPLKVLPLSATAVNTLSTATAGSKLKFKKISDDSIIITQMIGTWTTA